MALHEFAGRHKYNIRYYLERKRNMVIAWWEYRSEERLRGFCLTLVWSLAGTHGGWLIPGTVDDIVIVFFSWQCDIVLLMLLSAWILRARATLWHTKKVCNFRGHSLFFIVCMYNTINGHNCLEGSYNPDCTIAVFNSIRLSCQFPVPWYGCSWIGR